MDENRTVDPLNRDLAANSGYHYTTPIADNAFDIAPLRGVLHHLNDAQRTLHEAMRVARTVVVIEPTGYNPVLKVLEKVSRDHAERNEKSSVPELVACGSEGNCANN